MSSSIFSDEIKSSNVGALFPSRQSASLAVDELHDDPQTSKVNVLIVGPDDSNMGRKLEPENNGIRRTLLRSHFKLGVIGLFLGLVVYIILRLTGVALITSSPVVAMIALLFLGGIAGLLMAGLVTLRPDHDRLLDLALRAKKRRQWLVVAHAKSHEEMNRARDHLRNTALETVATI